MNARGLKRTLAKEEPGGSPVWRGQCGARAGMEGFGDQWLEEDGIKLSGRGLRTRFAEGAMGRGPP